MDVCKACGRNLGRSERSVLCSGMCGSVFHPGCVGLNATNFKAWTANVGLLWFCENCRINFNPSVMDREALILKTMRELLLRVDSMDLRIGQYGENLKTLNNLLSTTTSARRDSNISARLQRLLSGPSLHDHSEFYTSIDRFNLDSSLHSNAANNTIVFPEEDEDTMLNDSASNVPVESRNIRSKTYASSVSSPTAATNATNSISPATSTATTTVSATATIIAPSNTTRTTANNTAVFPEKDQDALLCDSASNVPVESRGARPKTYASVVSSPTATTATTNSVSPVTSAAVTAVSASVAASVIAPSNTTRTATTTDFATTTRTRENSVAHATPASNSVPPTNCRLKVVSKQRQTRHRDSNEEQLKSFYVTPFTIEQTEDDIVEYLRETINTDDSIVKCVKLVPRNKDINELSFISFKISVSENLANVISDSFYWPEGVEIREFQPKNEVRSNQIISI